MGKWLAGIVAAVIAGVIVWWITTNGLTSSSALTVTAWYTPDPIEIGKAIDITVKVRTKHDRPVSNAAVTLTPVAGTFTWAGSGGNPIKGQTNQDGLFSTKFQTVALAGIIGAGPPPGNSRTGEISVLAKKEGYQDGKATLEITAAK